MKSDEMCAGRSENLKR